MSLPTKPKSPPSAAQTIPIKVEFGGGLEILFDNIRTFKIDLPAFISPEFRAGSSTNTANTVAKESGGEKDNGHSSDGVFQSVKGGSGAVDSSFSASEGGEREVKTELDANGALQAIRAEDAKSANISFLICYLGRNFLSDKRRLDLFEENGTVRPGILVLVNDSDWELEGEGEYVLQPNDEIVFISTLHGG